VIKTVKDMPAEKILLCLVISIIIISSFAFSINNTHNNIENIKNGEESISSISVKENESSVKGEMDEINNDQHAASEGHDVDIRSNFSRRQISYQEGFEYDPISPEKQISQESTFDINGLRKIESIRIDSNREFDELADTKGWEGDGSEEQPFVLEYLEVDGEDTGYSIYIGNVTKHFIIRYSSIHSARGNSLNYHRDSGIYLFNASNGLVKNNVLTDNRYGIYLHDSSDNTIKENVIYRNVGPGIFLLGSESNDISKNQIKENEIEGYEDLEYEEETVLVKFDTPAVLETTDGDARKDHIYNRIAKIRDHIDISSKRIFSNMDSAELKLEGDIDVKTAIRILSSLPGVEHAEPNYLVELFEEQGSNNIPNDPGFHSLWGMQNIDTPGAWDVTTGDEDIIVAVLDTGIDYNHEDLADNMWENEAGHHGYNFVNDSYFPLDDHGHGTHVAGTIGAVGNNEKGLVGVNWNISMMSLKFIDSSGSGTIADAVASLDYVLTRKMMGDNIIATCNSWGGTGRSQILAEAISRQRDAGILFVTAAGNSNRNIEGHPTYPASFKHTNIITVGATDLDDNKTNFSNYGENSVHVSAPGKDINSTDIGDRYTYRSGTSMSAPHVSGLAALIASTDASYDHNQIKNIILSSTDRLDSLNDTSLTEGRINASKAMEPTIETEEPYFWIHRPGNSSRHDILSETGLMVSITDGIDPISGINVSVEFDTGEDKIYLQDDGIGWDQVEGDGYYSGGWIPEVHGEIKLTFTARSGDREMIEKVQVDVGRDAGIESRGSRENDFRENNISGYNVGMSLLDSDHNKIRNNNFSYNENGISLERSNHTVISRNEFFDISNGISLMNSRLTGVIWNEFTSNTLSLLINGGDNNLVTENDFIDAYIGLLLSESDNNMIEKNDFTECSYAIDIYGSLDNKIMRNTGDNNSYFLSLFSSLDSRIHENIIRGGNYGILHYYSMSSVLGENSMEHTGLMFYSDILNHWKSHDIDMSNTVNDRPIYFWKNNEDLTIPEDAGQVILVDCENVVVEDLTLHNTSIGIMMAFSEYNVIANNTLTDNRISIYLYRSHNNVITSNFVEKDEIDNIRIFRSNHNKIEENDLKEGNYAISLLSSMNNHLDGNYIEGSSLFLDGSELKHWNTHAISTDNKVNGKPVVYWNNKTGGVLEYEAGQIILSNSTGVEITDQHLSGITDGIIFGFSDYNSIKGSIFTNNSWGIYMFNSDHNLVEGNILINNTNGITLISSERNFISSNTFMNNTYGVLLVRSDQNEIYRNDFSKGRRGVSLLFQSQYNDIYHNNFFESELGPGRDTSKENRWYREYPGGGNYWYDHDGEDRYSGVERDEEGPDGFADTPYEGDGFKDEYPLIDPFEPLELWIETPEHDSYVNQEDVTMEWVSRGGIGTREHLIRKNDGEWKDIGQETVHVFKDLEEEVYTVQVKVIDNAEDHFISNTSFTVDTTSPVLKISEPKEDDLFHSRKVDIRWEAYDQSSGIKGYEIRINKGRWVDVGQELEYEASRLRNGKNQVEVRAWDRAGNSETQKVTFYVYVQEVRIFVPLGSITILTLFLGFRILMKSSKDRKQEDTLDIGYRKEIPREHTVYKIQR